MYINVNCNNKRKRRTKERKNRRRYNNKKDLKLNEKHLTSDTFCRQYNTLVVWNEIFILLFFFLITVTLNVNFDLHRKIQTYNIIFRHTYKHTFIFNFTFLEEYNYIGLKGRQKFSLKVFKNGYLWYKDTYVYKYTYKVSRNERLFFLIQILYFVTSSTFKNIYKFLQFKNLYVIFFIFKLRFTFITICIPIGSFYITLYSGI